MSQILQIYARTDSQGASLARKSSALEFINQIFDAAIPPNNDSISDQPVLCKILKYNFFLVTIR